MTPLLVTSLEPEVQDQCRAQPPRPVRSLDCTRWWASNQAGVRVPKAGPPPDVGKQQLALDEALERGHFRRGVPPFTHVKARYGAGKRPSWHYFVSLGVQG